MKLTVLVVFAFGFFLLVTSPLMASNTDTQDVTMSVNSINEISASGNPGAMAITTATPGADPDSVLDQTTTYSVTTNEPGKKITGAINIAMPVDTSLGANLTAPAGGTSLGMQNLTTSPVDLVTTISSVSSGNLGITLNFAATASAGTLSSFIRTITYTLTN